jgi:hypothetical protein
MRFNERAQSMIDRLLSPNQERPDPAKGIPMYDSDGHIIAYSKPANLTEWYPIITKGEITMWYRSYLVSPSPTQQLEQIA